MKTVTAALAQHLADEVTMLATLWKVKRRDGQIYGFTDHDRDIAYDDGSGDGTITYLARSGYSRTAIQSTADLAVDNLDVETFFDAAGITEEDLRAGRWEHADTAAYGRLPNSHAMRRICDAHLRSIPLDDAQPGDVLLMAWRRYPQHLAIVVDHPAGLGIVHGYESAGRVVEHRLDEVWRARVRAAYTFPGAI